MTKAYDEIMERIPQLPAGERVQLRDYLKSLTATSNDPAQCALPLGVSKMPYQWADVVLYVLCDVMHKSGVEHVTPQTLRNTSHFKPFADKCPAVIEFFGGTLQVQHARIRTEALLQTGLRLLYEDLLNMGVTVSSRTMMQHIHRVPAVINAAFPGYAEAGLLRRIVNV